LNDNLAKGVRIVYIIMIEEEGTARCKWLFVFGRLFVIWIGLSELSLSGRGFC